MTEVELFQVLATKAILPYEAWKRLNAHYKLIGLPLTWSKNTRFWSEYIAVKTMENVSIPEYTNEQTVDAGSNQEMDLNLVNCCIDNRQKLRTIHFQEQLLVFATQSMLVIRRLLSDALLNQGASVASWPEFVRFLLCRLCVQYFSTPWDQHESSSFEEVSNIIALHQIVLHIFYNYNAICNWKHGQFIPWLWYHVEHLNMESALIRLMQHKRKWYPKPSCRDRTPLELCGSTRVLIRSESTRPSVISELAASTSSFIVSSTSQLQSSGSERKSDIHPYQLGLALSAVLSQAVHLIYVAQHEMQQYGIYHERCLHNHSLWDVKRATVHEVSRVLYNRVVMMLNSSTVMANCTGTLNDSADETILSCCQSSCHWCILLRAVCTAVLRLINVRGGTNDSSSSNLLGSLSSDSSVSTNDNIHIPICVKTHSHCIQCILNENAESGNSSFAERNYNTLGLGRKNKNFSHYPVVRQQWHSIPLELMLKQALWCFKDACLLLQQYHSLNTSVISKLNESMKWRTAARLGRLVPFAIGGALESVALYHLLEKYWQDGAVRVLPRVICLMQRIILEEVSICYERDYFCDERNVKRFSSSNNTKASINPSKPMLHLSWQEVDDHSHSKPTGKSLRHSTSSITDVNQSSLLTPYEKMKQERYEWHQQYSRQQRERMDRDGQIVDQGTGVSVKQLLSLLLRGSVWPDRSPLVVQYWVTQLGAKYTLADCLRQLLISRVKFTYNVNQRMLLFENALSLSIPLELLEDRARLALQALSAAFSVNDATFVIEPRGAAVPRQPFFNTRQVLSEGQSLNTHCGFRFNHVLENLIKVSRIALVRDISCEVLRIGFRVLASSAALDTISCALQQAFLHVQTSIGPLQERALRGCNFDDCLNRKELEQLFTLKEREQMILTLIGCVHRGVLYTLMQQYVSRGEIVTLQIRAPEASSSKTSRPA
jgi:hypothetical protein